MKETPEEQAIRYDSDGLVPCVVQDSRTGEVLTLAYMNAEAYRLRARRERFISGAARDRSSGARAETRATRSRSQSFEWTIDGDALVALAIPAGPACHTGERSCFFRDAESGEAPEPALHETLVGLERTLRLRQEERPEGSYTVELLDDPGLVAAKVLEEAEEVTRAAREESRERVSEEAADVLYHLSVLLRSRDVALADVLGVLDERRR